MQSSIDKTNDDTTLTAMSPPNHSMKLRPFSSPIYVTKPYMPPLSDFSEGLKEIWETKQLTNNGPVLTRFRNKLSDTLGLDNNLSLFSNGTLALQIGLQAMQISGEVITTPFSFVATTHALFWNKVRPVFVDIEPEYYTLNPESVEAAITPWTTAILAVHVFGNPCYHDRLADIASRHNIRLIYDAAHSFGVRVGGNSIAKLGDLSMFSFHATKLFHSGEGGMLVFPTPYLATEVDFLKNFGFKNETEVVMPGTNAKMNELQALLGLQVLDHIDDIIDRRKKITDIYNNRLGEIPGIRIPSPPMPNVQPNYAYYPIEVDGERYGIGRDQLYDTLKNFNLFTRRYFYPLICDFACYRNVPVLDTLFTARKVASQILTLPIYHDLTFEEVNKICDLIEYLPSSNQI